MLEKPDLQDADIIACLRESYDVPASAVEFLPIGNDATAWVYRVSVDDGSACFLKVKKGEVYLPSLGVPRYLSDRGIRQVVAPLLSKSRQLWTHLDSFSLILYPLIDGDVAIDAGMSDSQWMELGTVLKQIHTTRLPAELAAHVRGETFIPKWSPVVRRLAAKIDGGDSGDPFERELASFWRERADEINRIVERTEALGRLLQEKGLQFALCHADIHTANILLDRDGQMHIVDWDETIFAPKERDLMFVVSAAASDETSRSREERHFLKGYGQAEIDPLALAYYRYEWVVQEIGDFGERVFFTPDTGEATRADAVSGFRQLFDPGDVVEQAYSLD